MSLWSFEGVRIFAPPLTISAVIAVGVHLFPFRTEQLSPLAPMVLGAQAPGRVGSRRILRGAPKGALPVSGILGAMAQFHFAPDRYLERIREEIPRYAEFQ